MPFPRLQHPLEISMESAPTSHWTSFWKRLNRIRLCPETRTTELVSLDCPPSPSSSNPYKPLFTGLRQSRLRSLVRRCRHPSRSLPRKACTRYEILTPPKESQERLGEQNVPLLELSQLDPNPSLRYSNRWSECGRIWLLYWQRAMPTLDSKTSLVQHASSSQLCGRYQSHTSGEPNSPSDSEWVSTLSGRSSPSVADISDDDEVPANIPEHSARGGNLTVLNRRLRRTGHLPSAVEVALEAEDQPTTPTAEQEPPAQPAARRWADMSSSMSTFPPQDPSSKPSSNDAEAVPVSSVTQRRNWADMSSSMSTFPLRSQDGQVRNFSLPLHASLQPNARQQQPSPTPAQRGNASSGVHLDADSLEPAAMQWPRSTSHATDELNNAYGRAAEAEEIANQQFYGPQAPARVAIPPGRIPVRIRRGLPIDRKGVVSKGGLADIKLSPPYWWNRSSIGHLPPSFIEHGKQFRLRAADLTPDRHYSPRRDTTPRPNQHIYQKEYPEHPPSPPLPRSALEHLRLRVYALEQHFNELRSVNQELKTREAFADVHHQDLENELERLEETLEAAGYAQDGLIEDCLDVGLNPDEAWAWNEVHSDGEASMGEEQIELESDHDAASSVHVMEVELADPFVPTSVAALEAGDLLRASLSSSWRPPAPLFGFLAAGAIKPDHKGPLSILLGHPVLLNVW